MNTVYYNPKTGYTAIDDLQRKTKTKKRRDVENFLQQQEAYTRHRQIKRKFKRRRVYADGIDAQWQADLVDLISLKTRNKYFGYILTIVDVFSKYAFAVPIKKKRAEDVTKAFELVFKSRIPRLLQTDHGLEFTNRQTQSLFSQHGIRFFASQSPLKASLVERFNRSLKQRMFRYFTAKKTKVWIDILQDLVENYNDSYHRSIKMSPNQASLNKNEDKVRLNLYGVKNPDKKAPQFKIDDLVRIPTPHTIFKKGYTPTFSEEIYTIDKILETNPPTYQVKDPNNNVPLLGAFYEEEFSRVRQSTF
jgi:transposase InsO family protein